MLPKAVGVHSDLDFSGYTLCDRERLGLTSVGAVEGCKAVG